MNMSKFGIHKHISKLLQMSVFELSTFLGIVELIAPKSANNFCSPHSGTRSLGVLNTKCHIYCKQDY